MATPARMVLVVLAGVLTAAPSAIGAPDNPCEAGSGAKRALRRPTIDGCRETAPLSHAPEAALPAPRAAVPRDPERFRPTPPLVAADRRLLMQEIRQLEALFAATPTNSPDRPLILRRLAESYADLERRAAMDRIRAELEVERQRNAKASPPAPPRR